jgi:hypothetical protein
MQENLSLLHLPVNGSISNARGFCTRSGKKEGVLPVFNTCSKSRQALQLYNNKLIFLV